MFGVGQPSTAAVPISLTPQVWHIESFSFSADGRYLYDGTNATDSERRTGGTYFFVKRADLDGGITRAVAALRGR